MNNVQNELNNHPELFDVYDDGKEDFNVVHDDGFLHLSYGGKRYSFDVGQENKNYNRDCNQILKDVGFSEHVKKVVGNNN